MKKILCLLCTLTLTLLLAVPAMADLIWIPYSDDFYGTHSDECIHLDAYFDAITDVVVMQSPDDSKEVGTIPQGETVYIPYTWTDKESDAIWGYTEDGLYDEQTGEYTDLTGWAPLEEMIRLYDAACFEEEHEAEFETLEEYQPVENKTGEIIFWAFPGSGEILSRLDEELLERYENFPEYKMTWTDEDDLEWAYIPYYYGTEAWVCLSAPADENLPVTAPRYANNPESASGEAAQEDAAQITGNSDLAGTTAARDIIVTENSAAISPNFLLPVILVIVTAIATVIILAILLRKEKKK